MIIRNSITNYIYTYFDFIVFIEEKKIFDYVESTYSILLFTFKLKYFMIFHSYLKVGEYFITGSLVMFINHSNVSV